MSKKITKDIGIGFVTGRRHFKNVLRTYINNWIEHGLVDDKNIRLHLFIAYDLKYQNTSISDYKDIEYSLIEKIDSITFINEEAVEQEKQSLLQDFQAAELQLIFGEGYAKKRNSLLYFALKKGMDKLFFLDDDEYPLAVYQNSHQSLAWQGQRVLGTHLQYNDAADITHGHHCGYISPIPTLRFDEKMTQENFKMYIETLSNDILNWENIREKVVKNKGISYADAHILENSAVFEVKEEKGLKFISGSNLCLNLKRTQKPLPAFYNPPGARGEDTFLATCLSDYTVLKVPCYTFHDGFGKNKRLLLGVLPTDFSATDTQDEKIIERFIAASLGWLRYKPLLLYITQRENYAATIQNMRQNLMHLVPIFCDYFQREDFHELISDLAHFDRNVKSHYKTFQQTQQVWQRLTQSFYLEAQNQVENKLYFKIQ